MNWFRGETKYKKADSKDTTRPAVLNLETIDILKGKVFSQKMALKDFELIEDFLEAFGKSRNLILKEMIRYGIHSYEEFLANDQKPSRKRYSARVFGNIMGTTLVYLDAMADYFIRKQNMNTEPEIWELKNPETV